MKTSRTDLLSMLPSGAPLRREVASGTLFLSRMAFGNYRISLGDDVNLWSNYCYQAPNAHEAMRAFLEWDGEGDPEGWYRHIETGRRRKDYTPASEETWR